MRDAEPQRRPNHAPGSHRGFRPRPTSPGRARQCICSPSSYPSPRLDLPKSRSNAVRPTWPMRCLARSSPARSTNQSIT
eukprot:3147405-Alexandrium_andersonii.AAC.1